MAAPTHRKQLIAAVHESTTNPGPIVLAVSRDDEKQTYKIEYHGGEKYAALVRNHGPDLLTKILKHGKRAALPPRFLSCTGGSLVSVNAKDGWTASHHIKGVWTILDHGKSNNSLAFRAEPHVIQYS